MEPKRSAVLTAFGLMVALIGFGGAALKVHEAYLMHSGTSFDERMNQAAFLSIAGFVGTVIFAVGVLFGKEANLDLVDDEYFLYNRPVWQCVLVMLSGIAIAVLSYLYGVQSYASYAEADRAADLLLIEFFGILIAFVIFLLGLSMLARSPVAIRFRGRPHPVLEKSEEER